MKRYNRLAAGLLAAILFFSIPSEVFYRVHYHNLYFFPAYTTFNQLYELSIEKYGDALYTKPIVFIETGNAAIASQEVLENYFYQYSLELFDDENRPAVVCYYLTDIKELPYEVLNLNPFIYQVTLNKKLYPLVTMIPYVSEVSFDEVKDELYETSSEHLGSDIRSSSLGELFYGWEQEMAYIHMAQSGSMKIKTGTEQTLELTASIPEMNLPNTLNIFFDNQLIAQQSVTTSNLSISIQSDLIPMEAVGTLRLELEHAISDHAATGGADVTGYSLESPTQPNLFSLADVEKQMQSEIGDIRDMDKLQQVFEKANPEIVLHLAAQPIVRDSYREPVYTYETNVMGTVHMLECVREHPNVRSFLNVTTDKVYQNNEWVWGYRENEPLDGFDPYSNSKSCSELVTHSYKNSFFAESRTAISTARAGNVIGGGDFANDRIIPDCVRAAVKGERIIVRNPHSTRPYQHVLEPLFAYLMIAQKQYEDASFAGYYNVGPDECDCVTTGTLVDLFCNTWGNGQVWENCFVGGPHEANFLKLDCSKLKSVFGWKPRWHIDEAIKMTCAWTKIWQDGGDIPAEMSREITRFLGGTQ